MASTIMHSRGARTRTASAEPVGARVYERPTGAAMTGLTAVIVGAWGALAGYIGPYFDFRPVDIHVWVGSWQNGLLHLLPGAVAAAAGLMLLAMGPARRSVRGGAFILPALMLIAAGAWFVIGPVAWPTFHSGPAFNPVLDANRNLLNVACASFAPGLVLAVLGGMAMKAGMVPAVPVEDPYMPVEAQTAGAAPVAERDVAERNVAERDIAARDVAERETGVRRGTVGRDVVDRDVADRELADRGLPDRDVAGSDTAVSDTADRNLADREALDRTGPAERRGLWRRRGV